MISATKSCRQLSIFGSTGSIVQTGASGTTRCVSGAATRRHRRASRDVGGNSVFTIFALALVPRGFFFDKGEILVVDDALLARQRDETLAARTSNQRQSNLPGQVDTPGSETRTRYQNRNAHPHRLDDHLGGQPPGG